MFGYSFYAIAEIGVANGIFNEAATYGTSEASEHKLHGRINPAKLL